MYLYDYVIIFALEEEFKQFKYALCSFKSENGEKCDYRYYKTKPEIDEIVEVKNKNFKIYARKQNTPGMVSTGICATKLINEYKPKHIVLLGIAAGFGQEYGSVLIADFVSGYQQGKLLNGKLLPDGGGYPLNLRLKQILERNKDEIIKKVKKAVIDAVIDNEDQNNFMTNRIKNIVADIGPVATSFQVIADEEQKKIIMGTSRKAIGVEMEGFGIFQAAAETDNDHKPIPILIKSVCDHADIHKDNTYHRLAGFTSAYFFLKFLELDEIKPESKKFSKSKAKFIPLSYLKDRKTIYEGLIENAPKDSYVCFISITAKSDLSEPRSQDEKQYLRRAFNKGIKFKGIVVNPKEDEAIFRSSIESEGKEVEDTLLFKDAKDVEYSLQTDFWRGQKIEMKYAKVGLQFKLWLSEEAAFIEPYHFGRHPKNPYAALCGFSQILFDKDDIEYEILKDHFNKLWERSYLFWPKNTK